MNKNYLLENGLEEIIATMGMVISNLDNFMNQKIQVTEIMKDLFRIKKEIHEDKENTYFDVRRVVLLRTWNQQYEINRTKDYELLPFGHRSISYLFQSAAVIQRVVNMCEIQTEDYQTFLVTTKELLISIAYHINQSLGIEDYFYE